MSDRQFEIRWEPARDKSRSRGGAQDGGWFADEADALKWARGKLRERVDLEGTSKGVLFEIEKHRDRYVTQLSGG